MSNDTDVIVVGAGLAGLVATAELIDAGRRVILLDQEPEASLGGQAFWSFGGLFLVDSPLQRRLGIRDSHDLALQDWLGSAGFDREEDLWPRRWAEAYVDFASGEKYAWLREQGVGFFPLVQWAERGGYLATGHGNSVPRFHVTWGTGPGVVEPFVRRVREGEQRGFVTLRFRHRVTELTMTNGVVDGVPDHVDGRMLEVIASSGGHLINADRMWHYPEGIRNFAPIWSSHAIRILSGPSPLWLDARGQRLPIPLFPGFDTLGALQHILSTGYDYSWFLLNQRIIEREIALSGSEQNPDLTGRSISKTLSRVLPGAPGPVEAFKKHGVDFLVRKTLPELVQEMNALTGEELIEPAELERVIVARDRQITNPFGKDAQVTAIRGARAYLGDRLIRVARPHRLLDPAAGPLIAVRLSILTRKTLGGVETDLSGRVLRAGGQPLPGLFAAGEVAGFGGGGMHGYRALEGTFLGGCLFSGRAAGRAVARNVL